VSTILIGVDASERSADALAFGRRLAEICNSPVLLARAITNAGRPCRPLSPERDWLNGIGSDRVTVRTVVNPSPARALHELAETERAEIIIVGSSHTSSVGRVTPGTTGERLLQGAPCAVAVVPHGYRTRADESLQRIGVAYDGSEQAMAAVAGAVGLARAFGAELEVIGVVTAGSHGSAGIGPGYFARPEDVERNVREGLDTLVAALPVDVTAESVLLAGDPAQLLAERSGELDLMIAGSRGYGPLRSVLVGRVTDRLMHMASCPMIIVPRGTDVPLRALFGATASNLAN
jgi:nucleotide-binding universal stress UspA family protein